MPKQGNDTKSSRGEAVTGSDWLMADGGRNTGATLRVTVPKGIIVYCQHITVQGLL